MTALQALGATRPALAAVFSATFAAAAPAVPDGVRRINDIAYGTDTRQRMDVYLPASATTRRCPSSSWLHGGAWMVGNKAMSNVVDNKVAYWVRQKGYVFVSVGYRLSPQADPLLQARDVAAALAKAQGLAASWGGDSGEVHPRMGAFGRRAPGGTAGGLARADAREAGAQAWLGTVALGSAALDLERIMQARHMRFYDRACSAPTRLTWRSVSPSGVLTPGAAAHAAGVLHTAGQERPLRAGARLCRQGHGPGRPRQRAAARPHACAGQHHAGPARRVHRGG